MQVPKGLIYGALLGQHEPEVEYGIGAASLDGAFVRRLRPFDVIVAPEQFAETRPSFRVTAGFGALKRIGCAEQLAAPLEYEAQEDRAFGIIELVGLSICRCGTLKVSGRLAFPTASQKVFYCHRLFLVCRISA